MKNYSIMLKPASSLCDLRCRYCFYADVAARRSVRSFGMMQDSVLRRIMENIARSVAPGDHITLMFQGGEPMLAGLDFFRTLTEIADSWPSGISVSYALQTNAMHLDEAWCLFLKKHEFLVGVSHDLLAAQHNAARVDASGAPTMQRVERSISLLRKHDIAFNVLCTLTNPLARHPQQVWKRIVQLNLPYVQFTPCLGFLEQTEKSPWAITPERFASFYNGLFRLWLADLRAGRCRSIKLFDDVLGALAFGISGACGMGGRCHPQLVVEADGTVYPCDFYCLDEYALGSLAEMTISQLLQQPAVTRFLSRSQTLPMRCSGCRWKEFCGGGCERMRRGVCCTADDTFCGYESFLEENQNELLALARSMQDNRSWIHGISPFRQDRA